ncbi:hypothetical protein [Kiloniella laminariae]|uniref:hypothetical protein n=1 Tax=Kiloniella laminariae TaxID=454162 RepID=UPI00146CAFC6|nr:hypothetical protein [Kiloniella laminariae]
MKKQTHFFIMMKKRKKITFNCGFNACGVVSEFFMGGTKILQLLPACGPSVARVSAPRVTDLVMSRDSLPGEGRRQGFMRCCHFP